MRLYDLVDIEEMTGIPYSAIHRRFRTLNIKKIKTERGFSLYSLSQIKAILKKEELEIGKYYPLKTTEIYYIYESKLNKL